MKWVDKGKYESTYGKNNGYRKEKKTQEQNMRR